MINGSNVFSQNINLPRMLLVNKIVFVGLKVTRSISFQVYPFRWTEAHWILIFLGHLTKHFYSYIFIYLLIKHMIEHTQYCFLLQLQFFCRPFLINFLLFCLKANVKKIIIFWPIFIYPYFLLFELFDFCY